MKPLCAVIVETRSFEYLTQVIQDHMKMLPVDTPLFIFTSPENTYLTEYFLQAKLFILTSPIDIHGYNKLLTSPEFWKRFFNYERVLIFQHDSMLLRASIHDFYPYDYIGASWVWNKDHIGNGGLSLRNPKIMYEITDKYHWDGLTNEDHWITMYMYNKKIGYLAPIEDGDAFSVETKFILGSLGYHAIDKYLTPEQCELIKNQYK